MNFKNLFLLVNLATTTMTLPIYSTTILEQLQKRCETAEIRLEQAAQKLEKELQEETFFEALDTDLAEEEISTFTNSLVMYINSNRKTSQKIEQQRIAASKTHTAALAEYEAAKKELLNYIKSN